MDSHVDNILGAAALALTDAMQAAVERELGLSGQAAGAVVLLHFRPGMTVKRLAERLRLTHAGAVRLADRLQAQGWVERTPGEDRRTVRLRLTGPGRARLDAINRVRAGSLAAATCDLTDAEQAALRPVLAKILGRLTADVASGYANCRLCDIDRCRAAGCPVDALAPAGPRPAPPEEEAPDAPSRL